MTKSAALLIPALLVATAATTFAQSAPETTPPAPDPAPADGPVVVVSSGPVVVTGPVATGDAAPTTTPTTPPATQNTDWNDVSHINGQIVKVGETDDYRKSYRRTNISTNPIGWIIGSYSVSVAYGVTNNIAVRGDVGWMSDYLVDGTNGFSAGVSAPLYLKRTYRGAFVEPGLRVMRVGYTDASSCSGCSSVTVAGPEVLVGWHWTWDSGFNVSLAFGMGRNWSSDSDYNKIFPDGYFRIGYALGGSRK